MNQLDFQVTIHIPDGAVTPGGDSVILRLEQHLLNESLRAVEFGVDEEPLKNSKGQIVMELCNRARLGGVSHGVKVELGGVDIIWDDVEEQDELECDS